MRGEDFLPETTLGEIEFTEAQVISNSPVSENELDAVNRTF